MSLFDSTALLLIFLYALGSLGTFWGIPAKRRKIQILGRLFTLAGFILHSLLVLGTPLLRAGDELSSGYFMLLLAWSVLLVYFAAWRRLRSGFFSMTAAPLTLLLVVLSFKLEHTQGRLPENVMELLFALHITPMFISLGLLALAFGAGLLYLRLERKIKSKARLSEFDLEMPALNAFDRVNAGAVVLGFPLYTLALAAGFIALNEGLLDASGQMIHSWGWDPKEMVSLLVWLLYALLFYLRLVKGWRGRKTALLAILIFGFSVFSLLGVNFFLPTHHSFDAGT